MTIDRAKMLSPLPRKKVSVDMPEWAESGEGCKVWICGLNAREDTENEKFFMNSKWTGVDKSKGKYRKPRAIILSMYEDEACTARPLSIEDMDAVCEWPTYIVDRLMTAIDEVNSDTKKNLDTTDDA